MGDVGVGVKISSLKDGEQVRLIQEEQSSERLQGQVLEEKEKEEEEEDLAAGQQSTYEYRRQRLSRRQAVTRLTEAHMGSHHTTKERQDFVD